MAYRVSRGDPCACKINIHNIHDRTRRQHCLATTPQRWWNITWGPPALSPECEWKWQNPTMYKRTDWASCWWHLRSDPGHHLACTWSMGRQYPVPQPFWPPIPCRLGQGLQSRTPWARTHSLSAAHNFIERCFLSSYVMKLFTLNK